MVNWHRVFSQKILERGEEYLRKGKIEEIQNITARRYQTVVKGSEDYEVSFEVDEDNHVQTFSCSCPFFATSDNCKHVAAVLMKWEQTNQVLTDSAPENHQDLNTIAEIRHEISKLRYAFLGRSGFIEYHEARNFLFEMLNYLHYYPQQFLQKQWSREAFMVTNLLLQKFLDTPMDDDGEVSEFSEAVLKVWQDIYEQTDKKFHQEMFDWFTKQLQLKTPKIHYAESFLDTVETFWCDHFNAQTFYPAKLELIHQKILFYQSSIEGEWLSKYSLEKWLLVKAKLLEDYQPSKTEVEKFYLDNWQYLGLRNAYVEWLIAEQKFNKALSVIEQILTTQNEKYYRINYYQKLVFIYAQFKNISKQKEYLMELIKLNHQVCENYLQLKQLYSPETWPEKSAEIISLVTNASDRAYFYQQEKLFNKLLAEVMSDKSGNLLQVYDSALAKHFPEKVLALYKTLLTEAAKYPAGRGYYQSLVKILHKVKNLPQGEPLVQKIVIDWRTKYKKRPAMMEELDRL